MSKYLKVLKQIDKRMTAKGYALSWVGDGDEIILAKDHSKTALYDWATQCDLGSMSYVDIKADRQLENRCTFYLVYGNSLEETISDMGYNTDKAEQDCNEVQEQVSAFYEERRLAYS